MDAQARHNIRSDVEREVVLHTPTVEAANSGAWDGTQG